MLFDLLKNLEYEVIQGKDVKVKGLTMDSRKAKDGFLFIAIEGLSIDSHNFVNSAIKNGATSILIQKDIDIENKNITVVKVNSTRYALSYIASEFYGNPEKKLNLIGITGTNGKTSTAFFIESILREHGRSVGMIGTVDTRANGQSLDFEFLTSTTPDSIELMEIFNIMSKNCEDLVMEVSSHALELHKVQGIDFEVGIFTNLTPEHLDFHNTIENYFNAKIKLFSQSKYKIINKDDDYGKKILKTFPSNNIYSIGINSDCDFKAENIVYSHDKVTYDLKINNETYEFIVNIPGEFTIYNTLCGIAACYLIGVPIQTIKKALLETKGVPGRIQKVENNKKINVFVDYAHTPDSLENIIKAVKDFTTGDVIVIFGCGGDRDTTKRSVMGEISGRLSNYTIVTSDNPRSEKPENIIANILVGLKNIDNSKYIVIQDRKEAIFHAIKIAKENDSIIIAGKGHETYQIFADETIHFDDAEVAKEALEAL